VVVATAFPAVRRFVSCLPWYRSEGIVKDHYQVFCAQGLAAMMTHRLDSLTLIVALGTFPAHYRVILPR
jgi:hypothetical protein